MKLSRPSALAGAASLATLAAVGVALGVALGGLAAGPAYAAAGGLDPAFGTGGVETSLAGQGSAIAVQPDGNIVVAGELFRPGLPIGLIVERFLGS